MYPHSYILREELSRGPWSNPGANFGTPMNGVITLLSSEDREPAVLIRRPGIGSRGAVSRYFLAGAFSSTILTSNLPGLSRKKTHSEALSHAVECR